MASQARVRPSWKKNTRRSAIHQVRRNHAVTNRLLNRIKHNVLEKIFR